MPTQAINVAPPALMQAAASVAATAEKAATPSPGAVPATMPGSPADAALAAVAAGIAAESARMSAELAGKGPRIEAATQAGIARLRAQDEQNAARIQAVRHSGDDDWFTEPGWHDFNEPIDPGGAAAGPGAIGRIPDGVISPTGFTTSLGDGWDDEAEEDMDVPHGWIQDWTGRWGPPVIGITGAQGGGGHGRAPI